MTPEQEQEWRRIYLYLAIRNVSRKRIITQPKLTRIK